MSPRLVIALAAIAAFAAAADLGMSARQAGPPVVPADRVLRGLPPERVREVMDQFDRALGVECVHCHVVDRWDDESKPQLGIARNMFRMVEVLNRDRLRDLGTVACWTCHRGEVKPSRLPRPELDKVLAGWPAELSAAPDGQRLAMAVYNVSLGVTCDHCHDADWTQSTKPAMRMVPRMNAMFEEFPRYMPASARTQCYMCHKGSTKPPAHPD